ncbi:beta-ketoacyl-[acyl-carrier-protein] synthase family protein [Effusibacillus consociatus]|uniref:Beta-ketoacyl-[acyl-carrier-protein] synthase family protein n=1 Tax=Effusibacillus consociatus TaxID=1117041 RepID=A0ABV9Q6R5_9BACL
MGKVVVTGYGIKAPGVRNKQEFKDVLEQGICTQEVLQGIGPNGSDLICGVIHDRFEKINGRNYKHHPRASRLAVAAADDAIEMAGLRDLRGRRVAILIGSSTSGLAEFEAAAALSTNDQFKKFPFWTAGLVNMHSVSSAVAGHLGIQAQVFTLSTGCTASSDALLLGKLLLESGQSDVCIAGGAEAPFSSVVLYSFAKLNSLPINQGIHQAGVPFSSATEGFVMSEGAAVLILEREADAISRDASIFGIVNRGSANNDGLSINRSDQTGNNMISALRDAVGSIVPTYVNSQALGLNENDTVESIAHRTLFGTSVPITSIKGMIGHAFGASGGMQIVSALLSMEYGFIPPTSKTSGEGYGDLPIVLQTRYCEVRHVAITTHGYGGNNACLLVSKYTS